MSKSRGLLYFGVHDTSTTAGST